MSLKTERPLPQRSSPVPAAPHPHHSPSRWGWPESLVAFLYCAVVATGVHFHEPWPDEAQAWLLARDLPWHSLFHAVRYEGTPALWHSMLWLLQHVGLGYTGMHWFAAMCAFAGVVLILALAPFPRPLRLLLPFTFFFAYQDAVIARSYVLFAAFAFAAAALLRSRRPRPWLTALALGLLANLSVHGLVLAAGLGFVAFRLWRTQRVPRLGPSALLAALLLFSAACIFPPHDIDFPAGRNLEHSWTKAWNQVHGRHTPPLADADQPRPGELAKVPVPHPRPTTSSLHRKTIRVLALMTYPLSSSRMLGLLTVASLVGLAAAQFSARDRGATVRAEFGSASRVGDPTLRLALVPYALLLLVFQSLYFAPRHAGTLFTSVLVTAWLLWPRPGQRQTPAVPLLVCLLLVACEQTAWTAHALRADIRGAYAPSVMTANFLRQEPAGTRIAGFYYHSIGPLPFFPTNIYENQPHHSFWLWSTANRVDPSAPAELARRPAIVVISGWEAGDNQSIATDWQSASADEEAVPEPVPYADIYNLRQFFLAHGYRETHRFCGHSWMRFSYAEESCDFILEPNTPGAH